MRKLEVEILKMLTEQIRIAVDRATRIKLEEKVDNEGRE